MTIPFETHDVEDDLDLHSAVCREIHPFDGCKCPLRDKPGRENSIDVRGADMLYLKTAQHQHEHPACVRTDISLCAFAFLSRVQQMLSRWTWLGRDHSVAVCHSLPRDGDKTHRPKLSPSFCVHRYDFTTCKLIDPQTLCFISWKNPIFFRDSGFSLSDYHRNYYH